MTTEEHIDYWVSTAEHDMKTAESLFISEHYDWCLFIGHLVIEKILKAHYVKEFNTTPPRIHNLVILSKKLNIEFTTEIKDLFDKINDFHLEARYPEKKLEFYKVCDYNFSKDNFDKMKELYQWLKMLI